MDKLLDRIKKTFGTAWKTVIHAKRQFLPFLLALYLMAFALFTVALSFQSAIDTQIEATKSEYSYHLTLAGLTRQQYSVLKSEYAISAGEFGVFTLVNEEQAKKEGYQNAYIYLELIVNDALDRLGKDDSLQGLYRVFVQRMTYQWPNIDASQVTLIKSPLFMLPQTVGEMETTRNWCMALATLLSAIAMLSLYRIRTNNEKFLYGIYATFGANTVGLRVRAFLELAICAVLSILPAYYSANIACLIFFERGTPYAFRFQFLHLGILLSVLLLLLIVVLVAVYLPMKIISHTEPMKLIVSEDNSNLLSRPSRKATKRSFSFPLGYTWLSTLRFRRHHIGLALTSAFLSVIFVTGLYLSGVLQQEGTRSAKIEPNYKITFDGMQQTVLPDDAVQDLLSELPRGVDTAYKSYSEASAASRNVYLSLPRSSVYHSNDFLAHPLEEEALAAADLRLICAADEDLPRFFASTYEVTGDLSKLLDSDDNTRYIAIGRTRSNKEAYNLSVGDTVTLSKMLLDEQGNPVLINEEDNTSIGGFFGDDLLKLQIEKYQYESVSYTVCAILEDFPTAPDGTPVILPRAEYERLAEGEARADVLYLVLDPDLTSMGYSALRNALIRMDNDRTYLHVEDLGNYQARRVELHTPFHSALSVSVGVTLLIIPVLWFFSQALFYRKRENEFYILQSISAPLGKIRSLYLIGAWIMIPIGILSALLSVGFSLLIHFAVKYALPIAFGVSGVTIAQFDISPVFYILCFAITAISGMLSAFIPYLGYRKRFLAEQQQDALYED